MSLSAERNADTDFVRTFRHQKGENAIDDHHCQRAKPAKITNKDVVEAGVDTASETTAPMVFTSLTGTSRFCQQRCSEAGHPLEL
jgi:hypothetical protein